MKDSTFEKHGVADILAALRHSLDAEHQKNGWR